MKSGHKDVWVQVLDPLVMNQTKKIKFLDVQKVPRSSESKEQLLVLIVILALCSLMAYETLLIFLCSG